jgi:hypothetical protein
LDPDPEKNGEKTNKQNKTKQKNLPVPKHRKMHFISTKFLMIKNAFLVPENIFFSRKRSFFSIVWNLRTNGQGKISADYLRMRNKLKRETKKGKTEKNLKIQKIRVKILRK